jgi:hypothetical protein
VSGDGTIGGLAGEIGSGGYEGTITASYYSQGGGEVGSLFSADAWPSTVANAQWGIGNGSAANTYWTYLGYWDETAPIYPKLYYQLAITTVSLKTGVPAVEYKDTLRGNNITEWALNIGSLPDGFTLDGATGIISGTLSAAGESTFSIRASNANGDSEIKNFTIRIAPNTIDQTITWNQDFSNLTYGDAPISQLATASSGLVLVYGTDNPSVATITDGKLTIVGAGEVTITASQAGDEGYNSVDSVKTITIAKKTLTINLKNADLTPKVYDGTLTAEVTVVELDGEVNSETLLPTEDFTWTAAFDDENAGSGKTVTVTVSLSEESSKAKNYQLPIVTAEIEGTYSIAKSPQTIDWDQILTAIYDGDGKIILTATAGSGFTLTYSSSNENVAKIDGYELIIVGVGTAIITAKQDGDDNYTAITMSITLTVIPNTVKFETCKDDTLTLNFAGVEPFTAEYSSNDAGLPTKFSLDGSGDYYKLEEIGEGTNLYQAKVPLTNPGKFEFDGTITDDDGNGINSFIAFDITVNPTPTIEFPKTVDPCDGGDILVILSGTPPFTVEYNVSESGKAYVPADKLGLKNFFGEGGYPLQATDNPNEYSAIIPSGNQNILTFEKISIVDGKGCKGK